MNIVITVMSFGVTAVLLCHGVCVGRGDVLFAGGMSMRQLSLFISKNNEYLFWWEVATYFKEACTLCKARHLWCS